MKCVVAGYCRRVVRVDLPPPTFDVRRGLDMVHFFDFEIMLLASGYSYRIG